MNPFRSFLAVLAACAVLFSPMFAFAGEQRDASTPASGSPYGQPGAAWDGTSWRVNRADPSGILRTAEEYPPYLQAVAFTGAVTESVRTGLKQIGNGWTAHPYGDRVLRVRRVATGGSAVGPAYLYLYGSDDNVNFVPLITSDGWVGAGQAITDSARVDTVRMVLPSSPATYEFKVTLPTTVYPGRYLAIWAKRDSAASSAMTLTLTYEGRYR